MTLFLNDFRILRPVSEHSQTTTLEWLAAAHRRAESIRSKDSNFDPITFEEKIHALLNRVGSPEKVKIQKRGTQLLDVGHTRWQEMDLFKLSDSPSCIGEKTEYYGKAVDRFFEEFYPENETMPDDLIHVTCTGYLSPSGAQKIVAKRNAGRKTTVTHAYHMGCYASIPALRMARGFAKEKPRVDIVHTELCSLHLDPFSHSHEQLVVQSLFGDGCIRYSISPASDSPCLALLGLKETTLPDTAYAMTWQPASWGMQMSLKKEVPNLIADSIEQALDDLGSSSGFTKEELQQKALFAIHPGGPKIIETVANLLRLQPSQYQHSYSILENYGNMSSATLPHIWESMVKDKQVPHDTLIVSLSFGPGLTVASSLMQKKVPA